MRVFATMSERAGPGEAAAYARRVEAMGYDGLLVPEAVHDGLLTSMAALTATTTLRVLTSVLVVFPRSPMTTAIAAWDLQAISSGRFELGLGTQVRGNITRRYSTPWTSPVPRMREYVESLRAIFDSFQTGAPLEYKGEHYRFSQLQPFFNPGPLDVSAPKIHLGAIGPDMTRMAAGIADGLISHPTHSAARTLEDVTLPLIAEGARRRGRSPQACPVLAAGFILTGPDDAALGRKREAIREQFSFLYSTPAYWPALDRAGFGDLGRALYELVKRDRWQEMKALVSDQLIDALVPQGRYAEIARTLREEYGGLVEAMTFPVPEDTSEDVEVAEVVATLRRAQSIEADSSNL
jgi:probable F420-dependent oxidoreductase